MRSRPCLSSRSPTGWSGWTIGSSACSPAVGAPTTPTRQNFLDVLFHSDSDENRFSYSNEEVDALLEEAAVEPDVGRRVSLYQQAEQLILDDWVAVPLWHSRNFLLVQPYVKGFELTPIRVPQLQNISIER